MSDHYDSLEIRSPEERERDIFSELPGLLRHAKANAGAYAKSLADIDPLEVRDRDALASLPVTRKSEMAGHQAETPPFGGFAASAISELARVFLSPGPIFEPQAHRDDYWRVARALHAAGVRRGDLLHNSFSYHLTPAGAMLESGAHALGCCVFPGGVGQTEFQVEAMSRLEPQAYAGTPSFLDILLEKAAELGRDFSSLDKALVSGEALPPSLREKLNRAGVARVRQGYATAEAGLIAYESEAMEGMIVEEKVVLEVVRPGTGDPVATGEVGEVLVTVFNPDYPLIRFATGDLSALMEGTSPCGRTNLRIRGWMGRADQTTKVRGMFVHPSQVAEVLRRHPEVGRGRLVVDSADNRDSMTLHCEVAGERPEGLDLAVAASLREVCKLRGEVCLADPGALPNDGKVIDDVRSYE
jgi:phenylacetate-CoA ligase